MRRREFITSVAGAVAGIGCGSEPAAPDEAGQASRLTVDFHQHTNYKGRSDDELVAHQRKMGVDLTVLLPAGSRYGLAAEAYGNDSIVPLSFIAARYPHASNG